MSACRHRGTVVVCCKKHDLLWSVANTRSVVFCCKHKICCGVVVCFCCGLLQTHDLLRSVANANCWGLLQTRFVVVVCCKHTICCGLLQTRSVVVCCKTRSVVVCYKGLPPSLPTWELGNSKTWNRNII